MTASAASTRRLLWRLYTNVWQLLERAVKHLAAMGLPVFFINMLLFLSARLFRTGSPGWLIAANKLIKSYGAVIGTSLLIPDLYNAWWARMVGSKAAQRAAKASSSENGTSPS